MGSCGSCGGEHYNCPQKLYGGSCTYWFNSSAGQTSYSAPRPSSKPSPKDIAAKKAREEEISRQEALRQKEIKRQQEIAQIRIDTFNLIKRKIDAKVQITQDEADFYNQILKEKKDQEYSEKVLGIIGLGAVAITGVYWAIKETINFIYKNSDSIIHYGSIGLLPASAFGMTLMNAKILEERGHTDFIVPKALGMTAGFGAILAGGINLYSNFKEHFLRTSDAYSTEEVSQTIPSPEKSEILKPQIPPISPAPTTRPSNSAAIAVDPTIKPTYDDTAASAPKEESLQTYFRVTASALNLRSTPNGSSAVKGQLREGSCVSVSQDASVNAGFIHIMAQARNSTKIDGYVSAQYLTAIPTPERCIARLK